MVIVAVDALSSKVNLKNKSKNRHVLNCVNENNLSKNSYTNLNPTKIHKYQYFVNKNISFKSLNKHNAEIEKIRQKYAADFLEIMQDGGENPNTEDGYKFLLVLNQCNKEILQYAKMHNISYIESLGASTNEVDESVKFLDDALTLMSKNANPLLDGESILSFKSNSRIIQKLEPDQRFEAHLIIHGISLGCAGVSATIGEACAVGADIPLLVTLESMMFCKLSEMLGIPIGPGLVHGAKHMLSAGIIGGRFLKWLNSTITGTAHVVGGISTAGAANIPLTAYLRTSNAMLSALLCEHMGWAFIRDYQNGKMNLNTKCRELLAFGVFWSLNYGFNSYFDLEKPAEVLQDNALQKLGVAFAKNASSEHVKFVKSAMEFLANAPVSKAAKGIELIIPAITSSLVENSGKLDNDFAIDVIKGSIFSLVCSDILGNISDGEVFETKSRNLILAMKQDPQIERLIATYLTKQGIISAGNISLGKNTVKNLETVYNEVVPLIVNTLKDMRAV